MTEPTREQVLAMNDIEFNQAMLDRRAAARRAAAARVKAANQRLFDQKYGSKDDPK